MDSTIAGQVVGALTSPESAALTTLYVNVCLETVVPSLAATTFEHLCRGE
jgi:hypothetical protein